MSKLIGLNGGTYTWRITDAQMIKSMLNAENMQVFESKIFEIANLKWQLLFYPNGCKPKFRGKLSVQLKPIGIPQMISKIVFFREFRILETGTCISYISQLSD
eukprot:428877_1